MKFFLVQWLRGVMSHRNIVEVRIQKGSVIDLPSISSPLQEFFLLEEEAKGKNFNGYARVSADGENLEFYQGHEDAHDKYRCMVRTYQGVGELLELLAQALSFGQLLVHYSPEGHPAEAFLVRPGSTVRLTADNILVG